MDKRRLKVGIIFNFKSSWLGGIIYIINVIKMIDYIDDDEKPEIFLFYNPDLDRFLSEINYPYMNLIEWNFPGVVHGYLMSWLLGKNIFVERLIKKYSLDAVYPVKNFPVKDNTNTKIIAWYADLQHKYYPDFFSKVTIIGRNLRLHFMLKNADDLVISSQSVKDDFYRYFAIRKELKLHVFHFRSINDNYQDINIDVLRARYSLPEKYFMVSNQFHKHKNHKVLLLALTKLKERGIRKYIAITGKFPKDSHSPYLSELKSIIEENALQSQISMLGVIPRSDQLQIMKNSQAVLQPSLFEGYSTVIEDAISLQVPVIASNLSVNIEQLGNKGIYFDPHNHEELAEILDKFPDRNLNDKPYGDYNKRVLESASILINLFRQ